MYVYIHIYRGDSSATLATYSNCMVIFRLHNTLTETLTLSAWPWHPRVTNVHHVLTVYGRFKASSPVCTYCALQSLMYWNWAASREFHWQLACEMPHSSSTSITWVIAVCNGQTELEALKWLYICTCIHHCGNSTDHYMQTLMNMAWYSTHLLLWDRPRYMFGEGHTTKCDYVKTCQLYPHTTQ